MVCFSCLRLQTLIAGLGRCRLLVEQIQSKHIPNGHVIFLSRNPRHVPSLRRKTGKNIRSIPITCTSLKTRTIPGWQRKGSADETDGTSANCRAQGRSKRCLPLDGISGHWKQFLRTWTSPVGSVPGPQEYATGVESCLVSFQLDQEGVRASTADTGNAFPATKTGSQLTGILKFNKIASETPF